MLFDIIFMIQHYVIYTKRTEDDDSESNLSSDSEVFTQKFPYLFSFKSVKIHDSLEDLEKIESDEMQDNLLEDDLPI